MLIGIKIWIEYLNREIYSFYFFCYNIIGDLLMLNNFEFKKSFGQNFLHDSNIIDKIVKSAGIDKGTLVIEIGPGAGSLSKQIIPLSKYSILYEIDTRLKSILDNELSIYNNYEIIFNDFLNEDVSLKIKDYNYDKLFVVANLPYYITTPIITKFIDDNVFPDRIVVMVQKEVADRFSAKVGSKDYGALTVFLNYYYNVNKLFDVSRNCFTPRPNVDSAVVSFNLKGDKLFLKDELFFRKIVKDCFQFKRKNIRNNLKGYNLELVETILRRHGYDLSCRAEMLSLEVFVDLANELK